MLMRKKGSVFALSAQRDRDLLDAYNRQVKKQLALYGRVTATGLAEKAVNSPAKRFWVSSERACVVISKMERGEPAGCMKKNKARFYEALHEAYRACREENPGMPKKHVVELAVARPAPCFALTPRVAKNIIMRMKKQCQWEKIERLRSKLP